MVRSSSSSSSTAAAGSVIAASTAAIAAAAATAAAAIFLSVGANLYGFRSRKGSGAVCACACACANDNGNGTEAPSSLSSSSPSPSSCSGHHHTSVTVTLPPWTNDDTTLTYYSRTYRTDEEMMEVAIRLSAQNVSEGTGGPFGSAVFMRDVTTGVATLVSVGVNRVVPLGNSTLHGETVAIQLAQSRVGSYTLRGLTTVFAVDVAKGDGKDDESNSGEEKKEEVSGGGTQAVAGKIVQYELFTSCEPCAMCLGATLWSGVSRIVCAAKKDDAAAIGFDEGPVFEESYDHLRKAGVEVVRGVMREKAAEVLANYGRIGFIYNR